MKIKWTKLVIAEKELHQAFAGPFELAVRERFGGTWLPGFHGEYHAKEFSTLGEAKAEAEKMARETLTKALEALPDV